MKTKLKKEASTAQKSAARLARTLLALKLHPATFRACLKRLAKLPAPALPLKGRGYAREDFTHPLNTEAVRIVWESIPYGHKDSVCYRRTGGYFGAARVVSPEAAKAIAPFTAALDAAERVRSSALYARIEAASRTNEARRAAAKPAGAVARKPRGQACGYLDQANLTDAEREELRGLISAGQHPYEGRALELKHKSGLTWGQIAN